MSIQEVSKQLEKTEGLKFKKISKKLKIYRATSEDIDFIMDLQTVAGEWYSKESKETIFAMLNNEKYIRYIGTKEEVPFGWVAAFTSEIPSEFQKMYSFIEMTSVTAILDAIIVHPSFQGQGLGKWLHGQIENKIIGEGCAEAYATVKCQNLPSINNLIKHNYQIKKFIEDDFGIRYIMQKKFTYD